MGFVKQMLRDIVSQAIEYNREATRYKLEAEWVHRGISRKFALEIIVPK